MWLFIRVLYRLWSGWFNNHYLLIERLRIQYMFIAEAWSLGWFSA